MGSIAGRTEEYIHDLESMASCTRGCTNEA